MPAFAVSHTSALAAETLANSDDAKRKFGPLGWTNTSSLKLQDGEAGAS